MDLRPTGTMPTFVEFIYPVQTLYFSFLLSSNNLFNIKNDNYYWWSTVFSLGSFYLVWENVTSVFFMSIQDIISLWFEWLKGVTLWCNLMSKWNFCNPWQAKQSSWFYWVWLVSSGRVQWKVSTGHKPCPVLLGLNWKHVLIKCHFLFVFVVVISASLKEHRWWLYYS